mmetsp:Transcript_8549/g.13201  ORF Transcript_8549/g.13201 Transcript_8549/m.13201 type:complete len:87 (-) Transcript_8549:441-701(-)
MKFIRLSLLVAAAAALSQTGGPCHTAHDCAAADSCCLQVGSQQTVCESGDNCHKAEAPVSMTNNKKANLNLAVSTVGLIAVAYSLA